MSTKRKPQTTRPRKRHAPQPDTPPTLTDLIAAVLNHPETPAQVRMHLSIEGGPWRCDGLATTRATVAVPAKWLFRPRNRA